MGSRGRLLLENPVNPLRIRTVCAEQTAGITMLKIYLFGRIRLQHEQSTIDAKITPTVQALLAYLLLIPGRSYSRDVLMELGWGDRPQDQARSCLNTALWRLRNILEPEGVRRGAYLQTGQAGDVGFNWDSDFWLDLESFESAANAILAAPWQAMDAQQAAQLEEVSRLYHGDLLEGMYYEWALQERERTRVVYLTCLGYLLNFYQFHNQLDKAIIIGQKILHHDPLREEVHREMMQIFIQNGQRAAAVQQYETCRMALQNELGILPMPETRALHDQILSDGNGEPVAVFQAPDDVQQAIDHLNHVLGDLDGMRQEVRRVLLLLNKAKNKS